MRQIRASSEAFAAIMGDGSVVTWDGKGNVLPVGPVHQKQGTISVGIPPLDDPDIKDARSAEGMLTPGQLPEKRRRLST